VSSRWYLVISIWYIFGTILTWLSGLNFPLPGAFISLLANKCVLYHIMRKISNEINKKFQDLQLRI
jgi:hypothetical protein